MEATAAAHLWRENSPLTGGEGLCMLVSTAGAVSCDRSIDRLIDPVCALVVRGRLKRLEAGEQRAVVQRAQVDDGVMRVLARKVAHHA